MKTDVFVEIKNRLTSRQVCDNMGYEINRAGFVSCGDEGTPSLKIYEDGGWQCFRCNEGGDCLDLLEHMEGWQPSVAKEYCMDLLGIKKRQYNNTKIVAVKHDYEALLASMRATNLDLHWSRQSFKYPELFALYKLILIFGSDIGNTEEWRVAGIELGCSWDSKLNPKMNQVIDQLLRDAFSEDAMNQD